MIQIEDVHIVEFRGIRDLHLSFGCEPYAIWGPNGSGKSGVVDALDFALTGEISRLRGAGSGGVTLTKHGPHVNRRDDPASAYVELTVRDSITGDTATLTRSVKTSGSYTLAPDLPSVRAAVERAGQHPELMLSRREIIKYVVAESGKRASEIQALLKLDRLGEIRKTLRSVKSKTGVAAKAADSGASDAQKAVERHLDLATLLMSEVLTVVNDQRRLLSLEAFSEVDLQTDLSAGLDRLEQASGFNKESAKRDLDAVLSLLADPSAIEGSVASLRSVLQVLEGDPDALDSLRTRSLVEAGLAQLVDEHCPLCDVAWADLASLRAHLEEKKGRSDSAAQLRTEIMEAATGVAGQLESVAKLVRPLRPLAVQFEMGEVVEALDDWTEAIQLCLAELSSIEAVRSTEPALVENPLCTPAGMLDSVRALLRKIDAAPDQSARSAAWSFLTIAQERWEALRAARARVEKASAADAAANAIYEAYCDCQDEGLALLYQSVQDRFSEFYRMINSEDESDFRAQLEPKAQKLDLLVDFYGIGMFPPVAYHSEGHQDGMGVCLYLALMERLLGEDFKLAILDDVVMSVDINHRRQFCALLQEYFPDVQFIITTHDEVWANQMQKSTLISKAQQSHFVSWSVDNGPVVMEGEDFWDQIVDDLERNDVSAAAARLRRNLEASLADLAEQLGGMVPYRSVGGWDLGEYMDAVKGRYSKLLKAAANAANSWNNDDARRRVSTAQSEWSAASLVQSSEQWAVNPAVHYNSWANFSKADFEPVVSACRAFLEIFRCSSCSAQVHLSTSAGREEALRCPCGAINFELLGR